MATSASSFKQMLELVRTRGEPSDRFLEVFADFLGLTGTDKAAAALGVFLRGYQAIEDDLQGVELEKSELAHLRSYLSPYKKFCALHNIQCDMNSARQSILKSDVVLNLVNVHLALNASVRRFDGGEEAADIALEISAIIGVLQEADLPTELKDVVMKRLHQMKCALEGYSYFGTFEISALAEQLVGTLVVRVGSETEEANQTIFQRIKNATGRILKLSSDVKGVAKNIHVVSENVPEIADNVGKFLGNGG